MSQPRSLAELMQVVATLNRPPAPPEEKGMSKHLAGAIGGSIDLLQAVDRVFYPNRPAAA